MKTLFRYLNIATLIIAFSALFAACADTDNDDNGNLGLNIKVFSPTVVIPGQPMTINGSGFGDVTEIQFPGDIVVTDFEIVTNEMIRVTAPQGLTQSGKIKVKNAIGEIAESRLPLSLGKVVISGYYPVPNTADTPEDQKVIIKGNETLTVYGLGMQFISRAEFIDEDKNAVYVNACDFVRVAPGRVVIKVPKKVLTGTFPVKLYSMDGQVFETPAFDFKTATGGGHWETTKRYLWKNDPSSGPVSWNGTYRFCLEGKENPEKPEETLCSFDADTWAIIKEGEFYFEFEGSEASNLRVTTGWWSMAYGGEKEFNAIGMAEKDDATGNMFIKLNINEDHSIYDLIDDQHLLFTGDAYTPVGIYVIDQKWVEEAEGEYVKVKKSYWKNETGEAIPAWGGKFRFCLAGTENPDKPDETIYSFDEETWNILKTQPFRIAIEKTGDPNIRITTGWWSKDYLGKEHNCADIIEEDENGNLFIELNLQNEEGLVELLDQQHLLFTGDGYKLLEIYQEEEVFVPADSGPKQVVIWENDPSSGAVSWNGTYRFCLEGKENPEKPEETLCSFDADTWNIIKEGEIYFEFDGTEASNLRVTTGWWSMAYGGEKEYNAIGMAEKDEASGHMIIKLNIKEEHSIYDLIDEQHLLFTGDAYTPVKLFYYK